MIHYSNLTFFYPSVSNAALSDVTATITPGIHLLLGENGAGKTTLLHLTSGLLRPSEGCVEIDGDTPYLREPSTLGKIFFISDTVNIPADTINAFARIHSVFFPGFDTAMFANNLSRFGQTGDEEFHSLSLGNRKKAILSYALALHTEILLLDEPANGLDITSKQIFQRLLAECVDETQTVILSTHTPSEFSCLYDGLIIISRSHLILAMPTWKISEKIAFGYSPLPPLTPLYMEQAAGQFRYIIPANEAPTDVDFTLLYNALLSPVAPAVIRQLNNPSEQ